MKIRFVGFVIISLILSLSATSVSAGPLSWLLRKEAGTAERAVVRESGEAAERAVLRESAEAAERSMLRKAEKEVMEEGVESSERALFRSRIASLSRLSAAEIRAAERILGREAKAASIYSSSGANRLERYAIKIGESYSGPRNPDKSLRYALS